MIGGWGSESNQEIVFVSFVRACERSCVWPRDDVASVAGLRKLAACSAVPCPSFAVAKPLPCFMLACVGYRQIAFDGLRQRQIVLDRVRQRQIALDRVRQCQIALDSVRQCQIALDSVRQRARINANLCVWTNGAVGPAAVCLLDSVRQRQIAFDGLRQRSILLLIRSLIRLRIRLLSRSLIRLIIRLIIRLLIRQLIRSLIRMLI